MAFSLGSLFLASLFFINAVAILNEERFLARIGWGRSQAVTASYEPANPEALKTRMIALIGSVQTLLRIPLIAVNAVVIVYLLILG